jgi:hypothetical protein
MGNAVINQGKCRIHIAVFYVHISVLCQTLAFAGNRARSAIR